MVTLATHSVESQHSSHTSGRRWGGVEVERDRERDIYIYIYIYINIYIYIYI